MPDTYNDGGIKFIRQKIVAKDGANANTNYIVRTGSLKAGVKRITSEDENGVERSQAQMNQIPTGSIELQFTTNTDLPPAPNQLVIMKDTSGANINVIFGAVDQKFGAGEEAMVTVEISKSVA
jgi:hypothetical protein